MDSEALPADQTTDEAVEEKKVVNKEKDMNGEIISHPNETENVDGEAKLKVECSTDVEAAVTEAGETTKTENQPIAEDVKKNVEARNNEISDSVVEERAQPQQKADISISLEDRDKVHEEESKKQHESETPKLSPGSVEKMEGNNEELPFKEPESEAAKHQVFSELTNELEANDTEVTDISTIPSSISETKGKKEEPVLACTMAEPAPAPKETVKASQDEEFMAEAHVTGECSEEKTSNLNRLEEMKVEETDNVDEEPNLKVECSTNVEAAVTEAGEKYENKNQPIAEDVKNDAEASNNDLSNSVVLSGQVVEEEAQREQKADISISLEESDTVHEEESQKQHESDTPELLPGSVERVEGNIEELPVKETESVAAKDQVFSELTNELEANDPEVTDISTIPSSISETKVKKKEPVLACTMAERAPAPKETGEASQDEEFTAEPHVTGECSEEKTSNLNRLEEMKVEETDNVDEEPNLKVECSTNVEATVTEAGEKYENKNQPITEDVKNDAEASNNDLSNSVVLPGQVLEEEAQREQKADISISLEESDTVHEEESQKQHESDTPELLPGSVEEVEGNIEELPVKETESVAAKDQVFSELTNELEANDPEVTDISTIPSSISETKVKKEEPVLACTMTEPAPAPKETVEASQDEEFMAEAHVTGECSEEKTSNLNRLEEMKVEETDNVDEEPNLKVECSTNVEVAVTEAREKYENKNQPIAEDVKNDAEASNNDLSNSVVLSGQVLEEEAQPQQKADISISLEEESQKQHESDTPELLPGSVEKVEGNIEELPVKETESVAAKDQVFSELTNELEANDPEVTDISTIPSSISETKGKKEEPVLACIMAEPAPAPKETVEASQDEEVMAEAHVTGECSEEKTSNLNRLEEMKVEETDNVDEEPNLKVECSTNVEAAVTEAGEKYEYKNQPIAEDVKNDAEASNNDLSNSVVLSGQVVEEEAQREQKADISISLEESDTVHEEESQKQHESDTPELLPGLIEKVEGNIEELPVKETESVAAKDQVFSELTNELEANNPEVTDISSIPSSISETKGKKEEPVSACAMAETVEASQDEEFIAEAHVTGECSEEKPSSLNRLEDMKIEETENVDEEPKLKVECSTNVEAAVTESGEMSKNKNQPIAEDVKNDAEACNNDLSKSVVLSGQVVEEEAQPQQKADISISLEERERVYEEESKKQHESDTPEIPPGSVEKAEGKNEELPVKEPDSEAAKHQVFSELTNELEANDPEVKDISTISSSISETKGKKEEPVLACTMADPALVPKETVEASQDEEFIAEAHVTGECSEEKRSSLNRLEEMKIEETENVDEESKLKVECSSNVEASVTEAGVMAKNKNQPIAEDAKNDAEASNNDLSKSVVLFGQVVEEEAQPQQQADISISLEEREKVHEEESKKQHESDTLELSPGSVEKMEGNNEELPVKEPESEAAKHQVFSELTNELEANDPEVTDISTIPSSISETKGKKEEPVLACTMADPALVPKETVEASQDEEFIAEAHVTGECSEEERSSLNRLEETENVDEESKLKVECSSNVEAAVTEAGVMAKNKNQPIAEDAKNDAEASNNDLSKSVVLFGQVVEEEAQPQQQADISISLEEREKVHEEESKKQHESDTLELSPGSVEKVEGNNEELPVKEPESEAAKHQVFSELTNELEANDPEVTDISTIPSSISETKGKKEEPVLACTMAEPAPAPKETVEASQDEEFIAEVHVTGGCSEEKTSNLNGLEEMKVEETDNVDEEPNLKVECSTNVETAVTEAGEKYENKNQPIADVKNDAEASNNNLSNSVVLSGQVLEGEAQPQQKADIPISLEESETLHEEESQKQHESDTPELLPGSVEKVEGNIEVLPVKEPESVAAKDQVFSELTNELEANDPEVTDISTIPSSISETKGKKEEPVLACTMAEPAPAPKETVEASQDEEFMAEAHVTGECSEEKTSNLNRLEEMKVEETDNVDEEPNLKVECSTNVEAAVTEAGEMYENKNQPIAEDVKNDAEASNNDFSNSVVLSGQVVEEEAQTQQKSDISVYLEESDTVHEEESQKQHESDTPELLPGSVERVEGNIEELPVKETESVAAKELTNELEANDPEVTDISTIPSSETKDRKEEPVLTCTTGEPAHAPKESVEASQDEEFVAKAHVTDERSEEKIRNSNRLEDEMKVEENFASEGIATVPVAPELIEAGGAVALEASDKPDKSEGGFLAQEDIKGTVEEKIKSCEAEDMVKVVLGDDLTEPPTAVNRTETTVAMAAIGTAEMTIEPETITDDKQETLTEVEEAVMDQVNESNSVSEIDEVLTKEERIADDKQEAVTKAEEQEIEAEVVNQANEAHATSETAQGSFKEEKDIVKTEMVEDKFNSLDNLNEIHMKTTNSMKGEAIDIGISEPLAIANAQSIYATSAVQTANEITQPKDEVTLEKQDTLTKHGEPLVIETKKVDSARADAVGPSDEEKANMSIEKVKDKNDDILENKTSMDIPNGVDAANEISEILFEEVTGPKDADKVSKHIDPSQGVGKNKERDNESLKDDKITMVETSKKHDGGTEMAEASLERKRSSKTLQMTEEIEEENLVIDEVKTPKDSDVCGVTEMSLEKPSTIVEVAEEDNSGNLESNKVSLAETSKDYIIASGVAEVSPELDKPSIGAELVEKCGNSGSIKITSGETTEFAGVDAGASNVFPVQDKASEVPKVVQEKAKEEKDYECSITKESKEESMTSQENYVETTKDTDVKEENVVAASVSTGPVDAEKDKHSVKGEEETEKSAKDENPKCDAVTKVEEAPKQDTPAKPSRHSNNIISKVKQSFVKAKKAIMGKSPSSKKMSAKSKEEDDTSKF